MSGGRLPAAWVMDEDMFASVYPASLRTRLARRLDLPSHSATAAQFSAAPAAVLAPVRIVLGSWSLPVFDAALLARLPALEIVFFAGGSVKSFVSAALWDRGIRVVSAAAVNARPVAEFAFAQIVFALKRVWPRILEMREGSPALRHDPLMAGGFGSTVGLLSLGRIGRLVVQHLRSLDVRVLAYDPTVDAAEAARLGVTLASLEEVFSCSDVVSCHLPLLPSTAGLLRRAHFAAMKPGATFINTARGSVVREEELIAVLRARPDLLAALDVCEREPLPRDAALRTLPNVLLTPHLAGSLGREGVRLGEMMAQEVERYLRGEALVGEVLRSQLDHIA